MRGLRGVASAVTRRKAARRAVRQAGRRGLAQLAAAGAGGQALAAAVIIDGARAASMAAAADPFSDENITKLWELAKLAYEPDASPHAVMELLDTRAIINTEDNVLAFRGTATKTDALKDVCYTLTPCRDYPALFGDAATGRVHQGFALAAESVFEELVAKLDRTFAARSSQRRRRRGRDVDSVEMSRGAYDVDIQWKQVAHHRYKTRAPDGPFVGRRFSRALRRGLDEKRRRRARVHLRRAARRRPGGMLPSRCMFFCVRRAGRVFPNVPSKLRRQFEVSGRRRGLRRSGKAKGTAGPALRAPLGPRAALPRRRRPGGPRRA